MSEGRSSVQTRGRRVDDAVSLFVNGKVYSGWTSVDISKKLNQLVSTFSLNLVNKWSIDQEPTPIRKGDKCHIHIGKQTVLDGYIDSVNVSITGTDRSLSVSGRSIALDLVDCSHNGAPQYKDTTMENIVKKMLEPFGVPYIFNSPGGQFKKINIDQGETVGEVIDRMCREKKLVVYPAPGGTLIFDKNGSRRAASEIKQGVNFLGGGFSDDGTNTFSEYIVKGQSDGLFGSSEDTVEVLGSSKDEGISRYRPMVIVAENSINNDGAKQRAQYEANVRAAQAKKYNISLQGWFEKNETLWDVNKLVGVNIPLLNVRRQLLIDSVNFQKSNTGTITNLSLARKDAYLFEPVVKKDDDSLFGSL